MRTAATAILVVGTMIVGAQLYLVLLPRSPALGIGVVVGTGAALAAVLLWIDQIVEEHRRSAAAEAGPDSVD